MLLLYAILRVAVIKKTVFNLPGFSFGVIEL